MDITIEKNEDGFLARCKDVQGGFAEGDTEFEAFYNLMDVLRMIADYRAIKFQRRGTSKNNFRVPFSVA